MAAKQKKQKAQWKPPATVEEFRDHLKVMNVWDVVLTTKQIREHVSLLLASPVLKPTNGAKAK